MEKSQRRVADYPLHRLSNQPVFQTEIPPTASVQSTDRANKKALLRDQLHTRPILLTAADKTKTKTTPKRSVFGANQQADF